MMNAALAMDLCNDEWRSFVECTSTECPELLDDCPSPFTALPLPDDEVSCNGIEERICQDSADETCCLGMCKTQARNMASCVYHKTTGKLTGNYCKDHHIDCAPYSFEANPISQNLTNATEDASLGNASFSLAGASTTWNKTVSMVASRGGEETDVPSDGSEDEQVLDQGMQSKAANGYTLFSRAAAITLIVVGVLEH